LCQLFFLLQQIEQKAHRNLAVIMPRIGVVFAHSYYGVLVSVQFNCKKVKKK